MAWTKYQRMRDDNWIKTSTAQGRQSEIWHRSGTNHKSFTELGKILILFEVCIILEEIFKTLSSLFM